MQFTYEFINTFFLGLVYASPILLFLILLIALIGQSIGKREGWSRVDSLYYAFITATTVGYGDFRPENNYGKLFAILIALLGLVLTGIIVSIGVKAASKAFEVIYQVAL